jgi:hypothetical protein
MRSELFNLFFLILLTACSQPSNTIVGEWKGKNHAGQDIQWSFDRVGKALSVKGNVTQDMFYMIDNTKDPWHLNLNSNVDTNTLRAIYRFTDTGKLVIGINNELVTRRPAGFDDPGVQKLILTKKE